MLVAREGVATEPFYSATENAPLMRPFVPLLTALLLIASAGVVAAMYQNDDYSMSAPGEVEIPERSLTVDDEEYAVRAFGRVSPGDTVRIDVSAPEDAEYSVYLYDRNLRIEQTEGGLSGSDRAAFSTGSLSPGSYLAAVYDGGIIDVYPVVVEGYRVTTEAPESVDGEFTVNVTVADGALTREPPAVQVVLGDDERSVRVDAERVADGEYRATLPTDGFDAGTYALYGVVRGEEETEGGDRVILAVGDRHEVEVEATATDTPDDGGDGDDDGDGDGGGGAGTDGGEAGEVGIEGVELLNGTVRTGDPVVVRVALSNVDPVRGRTTLNLTADGAVLTDRTVAVAASSERSVLLRTRIATPGTYALALDDRDLGNITVTAAETPSPTAPTTPPPTVETASPTAGAGAGPGPTTPSPEPEAGGAGPPASTASPAAGPPPATGADMVIALGMTLLLLYGVGVAVYVLREHPPSGFD